MIAPRTQGPWSRKTGSNGKKGVLTTRRFHVGFIPHIALIIQARKYGEKLSTGLKGRFYQPRPKGLGKVAAIMFLGPEGAVNGCSTPRRTIDIPRPFLFRHAAEKAGSAMHQ
jgi:hypothetical protein